MLVTVGGSLEPIAYSLGQCRPEGVVFLVSRASRRSVPALVEGLPAPLAWQHVEQVDDHENLTGCIRSAQAALQRILDVGIPPTQVLVDFTGGTKAMSAAAVLATHASGCGYSYVGGSARAHEDIGVVLSGAEVLRITPAEGLSEP